MPVSIFVNRLDIIDLVNKIKMYADLKKVYVIDIQNKGIFTQTLYTFLKQ